MNEINSVGSHLDAAGSSGSQVARIDDTTRHEQTTQEATIESLVDEAEFSELGQLMGLASDIPDVRVDKVAEAKIAIEQDVDQFIQDRLEGTVDRLIDDLIGQ